MSLSAGKDSFETILGNIRDCLDGQMFYAALVVSLTIPEVCASLEAQGGRGNNERYKKWYTEYLSLSYPNLTADDCYSLRCSVLHQGKLGRPGMQYSRVLFTIPNSRNIVLHNNIINDALNLDVVHFCNDVIAAARNWLAAKHDDVCVIENLPNLVRYRPQGLSPYIVGLPLIA